MNDFVSAKGLSELILEHKTCFYTHNLRISCISNVYDCLWLQNILIVIGKYFSRYSFCSLVVPYVPEWASLPAGSGKK